MHDFHKYVIFSTFWRLTKLSKNIDSIGASNGRRRTKIIQWKDVEDATALPNLIVVLIFRHEPDHVV